MAKPIKRFFSTIFSKIEGPVQNTIVFESNPEFEGNTGAVYEEMLKRGIAGRYKIIWLVKDKSVYAGAGKSDITYLEYRPHSPWEKLKKFYYLNRARAIIFENRIMYKSWKNQFVMNLTHGMPIKKTGSYKQYDTCDYILSSSANLSEVLARELAVPLAKVVTLGYPRNDVLGVSSTALAKLGLNEYASVIVWMPTFRKRRKSRTFDGENYPGGIPLLDKSENIKAANELLQKTNTCLVVKLHPEQDDKNFNFISESHIKYLGDSDLRAKGVKPYELLSESDALMTDYSSVYVDYLVTKKPVALVIDDIEAYVSKRGLAVNFKECVKGTYIYNFKELLEFFDSIGNNDYKDMDGILQSYEKYCDFTDHKSTERVVDFILGKI